MTRPIDRYRLVRAAIRVEGDQLTDDEALTAAEHFQDYAMTIELTESGKVVHARVEVYGSVDDEPDWMFEEED